MVYLITLLQKEFLQDYFFDPFGKFNPIQDASDNWIISANEYYYFLGLLYLDECPVELEFIKDLEPIEYNEKTFTFPE